jgi:DNA-3-methyladenine glycosylase
MIEVEAYLPEGDAAAHAFAGLTKRTRVIFGPPGHAYVYLNYGIHHLLNVVVEPEGVPGCVLLRAAEPVEGIAARMSGPGLLTRALGVGLEHYGADFTRGPLTICAGRPVKDDSVLITPRIGIRKAVDLPLRYVVAG